MWWLVTCPACGAVLRIYLEEIDGAPFRTPLHHVAEGMAPCPGSGQRPAVINDVVV